MTTCSLKLDFFYVASSESTVYSSKLTDSGETKLFIIAFKLAQLVSFNLGKTQRNCVFFGCQISKEFS